jgi:hypothetical protein
MKRIVFILLLCGLAIISRAQNDCVVYFEYKLKINSSTKIEQIGLPTVPFIFSYVTKMDEDAFKVLAVNGSTITERVASHLNGDLCNDNSEIINSIYKKSPEGLLVRIFGGRKRGSGKPAKPVDILIPLESIKFSFTMWENKKLMVIDLGNLSI